MPAKARFLGYRAVGPARGRIRATRSPDLVRDIERRIAALALFPTANRRGSEWAVRLARALRAERRAARTGGFGYDLVRHLALVRMARRLGKPAADRALLSAPTLRRRRRGPTSPAQSSPGNPAWPTIRAPKS
jgi:hypothetical protein